MTFARITLAGAVVSQPEKRFTPNNTAVTSFQLQVTPLARGNAPAQPYQVQVTCWARTAEVVAESVQLGATVLVEGRLQSPSIPQPDGSQKKIMEIEAQQVMVIAGEMVNPLGDGTPMGGGANYAAAPAAAMPAYQQPMMSPQMAAGPAPQSPMGPSYTDDDIPF